MKVFLLCILLGFTSCGNHECCSHTQYEKERRDYVSGLSSDELKRYNECKEKMLPAIIGSCRPGYYSDVLTQRCVDYRLHSACSKFYR